MSYSLRVKLKVVPTRSSLSLPTYSRLVTDAYLIIRSCVYSSELTMEYRERIHVSMFKGPSTVNFYRTIVVRSVEVECVGSYCKHQALFVSLNLQHRKFIGERILLQTFVDWYEFNDDSVDGQRTRFSIRE